MINFSSPTSLEDIYELISSFWECAESKLIFFWIDKLLVNNFCYVSFFYFRLSIWVTEVQLLYKAFLA